MEVDARVRVRDVNVCTALVIGYMDTAWDSLEGDERRLLVVDVAAERALRIYICAPSV